MQSGVVCIHWGTPQLHPVPSLRSSRPRLLFPSSLCSGCSHGHLTVDLVARLRVNDTAAAWPAPTCSHLRAEARSTVPPRYSDPPSRYISPPLPSANLKLCSPSSVVLAPLQLHAARFRLHPCLAPGESQYRVRSTSTCDLIAVRAVRLQPEGLSKHHHPSSAPCSPPLQSYRYTHRPPPPLRNSQIHSQTPR
ncbi:hypothetical protein K505DRAFT_127643 [Melanomma pulvis-pyrius CBS 109.77]|uniref:Uncharacterized protein n=1 Tax=Melanomma pulvis-pyrius CBS 109.77 TaxID=1314802 RepID=A0A6A6XNR5_9PLEO|nr:hypothetical protein K505DRAFT_127643 [Melanomma pulvis-pyrius CBS 109.77]